jgi:hypothetical protein
MTARCAWCGDGLAGREVCGFGATASPGVDLSRDRWQVVAIELARTGRTVPAFVVGADSPAARAGHDLYFMTCGEPCAHALRAALQAELAGGAPRSAPPA